MHRSFIRADDLLLDSFRLAAKIYRDGFRPDFLVGLWRGGSAVAITVQEGLEYLSVPTDHIAIRTSYTGRHSYPEMIAAGDNIRVHGLQYLLENLAAENSLLIVDDVYSTGSSVAAVIRQLELKLGRNLPQEIRTAAVWHRPSDRTLQPPDYYIHKTDKWLVLPYELTGLSKAEIIREKHGLADVMGELEDLSSVAP